MSMYMYIYIYICIYIYIYIYTYITRNRLLHLLCKKKNPEKTNLRSTSDIQTAFHKNQINYFNQIYFK